MDQQSHRYSLVLIDLWLMPIKYSIANTVTSNECIANNGQEYGLSPQALAVEYVIKNIIFLPNSSLVFAIFFCRFVRETLTFTLQIHTICLANIPRF